MNLGGTIWGVSVRFEEPASFDTPVFVFNKSFYVTIFKDEINLSCYIF